MRQPFRRSAVAAALAAIVPLPGPAAEPSPQVVPVHVLAAAPKADGDLSEWGTDGWVAVPVKPALERKDRPAYGLEESDDRNATGSLTVQLKAGVAGGRLFLAVRYPDATEDRAHQGWEWRGTRYALARRLADQFAVRFHLDGDFDRTMLSAKDYSVDVWLWNAARTDATGTAEDMVHAFTTRTVDDTAEYSLPGGKTVYIRKSRDAGTPPARSLPAPREHKGDKLPSFEHQKAAGSAGDVAARGQWKAGHWSVEFARALNTGHPDDVAFKPGSKLLGQIAVFNRGDNEHKSVSEPLRFDFAAVP